MPPGTEVGLGLDPSDIVFDGDQAPLPKRLQQPLPHFSAHVYCGQTAGWIKTPLAAEVDLGPGDCVEWGPRFPTERGMVASTFRPMSILAKRLYRSGYHLVRRYGLGAGEIFRWGPSRKAERGTADFHFSTHIYCGQTVAHLSYC